MKIELTRPQASALLGAAVMYETDLEDQANDAEPGDARKVVDEWRCLRRAAVKLAEALR